MQSGTDNIAADSNEPSVYMDNANVDIVTPSSAGISDDSIAEESILPDLDCEVDYGENPPNIPQPVNIKVEKVRVITPSQEKIRIKSEISLSSLSMDSDNIVADPNQEKVGERFSSPKKDAAEECDDSDSVSKDSDEKKENGEKAENEDENEIDASNGDKESFDPLTCTEGNNYDEDSTRYNLLRKNRFAPYYRVVQKGPSFTPKILGAGGLPSIRYRFPTFIYEIRLNEGHSAVVAHLKCNLVNFEIPKSFP